MINNPYLEILKRMQKQWSKMNTSFIHSRYFNSQYMSSINILLILNSSPKAIVRWARRRGRIVVQGEGVEQEKTLKGTRTVLFLFGFSDPGKVRADGTAWIEETTDEGSKKKGQHKSWEAFLATPPALSEMFHPRQQNSTPRQERRRWETTLITQNVKGLKPILKHGLNSRIDFS